MSKNSLGAKKNLNVGGKDFEIFDISKIEGAASLPFSLKVLLENLLRTEDGANITADHIKALAPSLTQSNAHQLGGHTLHFGQQSLAQIRLQGHPIRFFLCTGIQGIPHSL